METIITILISAFAFYGAASLLNGVKVNSFMQAIIVAVVIAILNVTLGILLKVLTLGILSLGLFTLILDAILILAADYFLKGFSVKNFWWALLLAAFVAIIEGVLNWVF